MKQAKLFKNGQSQAVRLPKEFRFEGDNVFIKRIGEAVVLLPSHYDWQVWANNLTQFSSDCFREREQPPQQVRDELLP